MWFGGQQMHDGLLKRLVHYGHGFHPLGEPTAADLDRLRAGMAEAGRAAEPLELIGGTRAVFPDNRSCADLGQAMADLPEQMEKGFTTFCIKPSQFTDDPDGVAALCREVVRRTEAM